MRISASNQLPGTITSITTGAVNAKVVIALAPELSITAIITNDAVQRLGLHPGCSAMAVIKATSVMVAVE